MSEVNSEALDCICVQRCLCPGGEAGLTLPPLAQPKGARGTRAGGWPLGRTWEHGYMLRFADLAHLLSGSLCEGREVIFPHISQF